MRIRTIAFSFLLVPVMACSYAGNGTGSSTTSDDPTPTEVAAAEIEPSADTNKAPEVISEPISAPSIATDSPEVATKATASNATAPVEVPPIANESEPTLATNQATLKPFSARYKSNLKVGWFNVAAEGNRTLTHLGGDRWKFEFTAKASVASLKETSEFLLKDGKIYPQKYTYRATGLITEKDRTLTFDHEKKQIFDHEKNEVATVDIGTNPTEYSFSPLRIVEIEKENALPDDDDEDSSKDDDEPDEEVEQEIAWYDNVQDNNTYMLQASLDLQNGMVPHLIYPVFERHRVKVKRFKILSEETLKTSLGNTRTIKALDIRRDKHRRIYIWLAMDHQFQLIRLQDQTKGKTTYQIDISRIH